MIVTGTPNALRKVNRRFRTIKIASAVIGISFLSFAVLAMLLGGSCVRQSTSMEAKRFRCTFALTFMSVLPSSGDANEVANLYFHNAQAKAELGDIDGAKADFRNVLILFGITDGFTIDPDLATSPELVRQVFRQAADFDPTSTASRLWLEVVSEKASAGAKE